MIPILHIAPARLVFRMVLAVVLILGFLRIGWGQTAGPNIAKAGNNVNGPGSVAWTNPGYITADDNNYATSTLTPGQTTEYLQGTDFGFSIPSNATIIGIQVTIMRQSSSSGGGNSINDADLYLLKTGAIVGSDKATTTDWPTSMGTATYGGASDLWGTTWTPADINETNFGVTLSAITQATSSNRTASVDYMQITVTYATPCGYADATSSGITHTPCINMTTNVQTVSTTIDPDYYFLMNVIKGLTYQVYTCESTNPSNPLKMTVYEEGNLSSPVLAFSASNTGNTCATGANNVFLSFTSTLSGQVRILINRATDCSSTTPADLDLRVNVPSGSNTQDNQYNANTDSWIGHIYDGTNSSVAFDGNFANYLGYYTQSETFNETYGGGGNDTYCFGPVTSDGTNRASVLTLTYSVRYRMNSTRKGLYYANIGSDDGSRLAVDESLIYNDWVDQAYGVNSNVLMNLTGTSSLVLDFYENAGGNQISFQSLTLILANNLNSGTSQTVCLGSSGTSISGDTYGSLHTGISLSGTGYQWAYGTSLTGPWTNISGATSAAYTPTSASAPFNSAGTYYIIRKAILSSTNNVSPNPYVATNESNAAVFTVLSPSTAPTSITGDNSLCEGESTTLTTNGGSLGTDAEDYWYTGACPAEAFTEEWTTMPYATTSTTVNSVSNGILNVTSTSGDPMIHMENIGSFSATTYTYVQARYRITAGAGGSIEIYYSKNGGGDLSESQVVRENLVTDGNWHIANVNMASSANWTGTITGWRYDWCTNSGVTMDVDFITLSDRPVYETGTSINVTPASSTTYYTLKKGACNTTGCASLTVTVNEYPTFEVTKSDINCFGDGDGEIFIEPDGGSGTGYEYQYRYRINSGSAWSDWSGWISISTAFDELDPGDYEIRLKDSNGCIQTTCTGQ